MSGKVKHLFILGYTTHLNVFFQVQDWDNFCVILQTYL